jgi:hypothetical protein
VLQVGIAMLPAFHPAPDAARGVHPPSSGLACQGAVASADGRTVAAVVKGGSVYRSTDGGSTFTTQTSAPVSHGLAGAGVDACRRSTLVAIGGLTEETVVGGCRREVLYSRSHWTERRVLCLQSANWTFVSASSDLATLIAADQTDGCVRPRALGHTDILSRPPPSSCSSGAGPSTRRWTAGPRGRSRRASRAPTGARW